jgi:hypothetical protein
MRNHYGNTPQEQARAEVLDMLEALAKADEDRNPHVETVSFNNVKRKHFAQLYYRLADQWNIEPAGTALEV